MTPDAGYFDDWYAAMSKSPARDQIVGDVLGLPPEVQSSGLVPFESIHDLVEGLALSPGDAVLDLACGRGGYGMEIARRTGARLIGIDFSAAALEAARSRIPAFGLQGRADFRTGELSNTGLPDCSVDGVICVDSIQFAEPALSPLIECGRVLVPGGRLVLTWWEARDRGDEQLPPRLRHLNVEHDLATAGFTVISVQERPDWQEKERVLWETALAAAAYDDDAVRSLQEEAVEALEMMASMRRLWCRALAPA